MPGFDVKVFNTFSFWSWPTPVSLQDDMLPIHSSAAEIRSLMSIRLPCPHKYCHSNVTKSTFYRILPEFIREHALTKDLLKADFDWAHLFDHFPFTKTYARFFQNLLSASD